MVKLVVQMVLFGITWYNYEHDRDYNVSFPILFQGTMNKNHQKIIIYDYGGYYATRENEPRWNSRDKVHQSLRMETEEVTYSAVVNKICRKANVDETTTELKLSYVPNQWSLRDQYTYLMMMMLCVIWI